MTSQPDPLSLTPLLSADPTSISHLFEADPTNLTPAHFDQLILELRRRRSAHLADEAAKQAKGKSAKAPRVKVEAGAAAEADKPLDELSLDDLM